MEQRVDEVGDMQEVAPGREVVGPADRIPEEMATAEGAHTLHGGGEEGCLALTTGSSVGLRLEAAGADC